MTEKITDVTAIQQRKKFLAFVDALSKYPPMTFREYIDADGNHTNWFPQRVMEFIDDKYKEWFTLAVLNNFPFMLRIKQRDPDAINIFHNASKNFGNMKYLRNMWVVFNFDFHGYLCDVINQYNKKFKLGNINKTSSAITIKNNFIVLQRHDELINELKVKKYTRDVKILRNFYNFVEERKKDFNTSIGTASSYIAEVRKRVNVDEIMKNLDNFLEEDIDDINELMTCNELEISAIIDEVIKCSQEQLSNYKNLEFYTHKESFIFTNNKYRLSTGCYDGSINNDDISNIYRVDVISDDNSEDLVEYYGDFNNDLLFSCKQLHTCYLGYTQSKIYFERENNSAETLSLLMENIAAVLNN